MAEGPTFDKLWNSEARYEARKGKIADKLGEKVLELLEQEERPMFINARGVLLKTGYRNEVYELLAERLKNSRVEIQVHDYNPHASASPMNDGDNFRHVIAITGLNGEPVPIDRELKYGSRGVVFPPNVKSTRALTPHSPFSMRISH